MRGIRRVFIVHVYDPPAIAVLWSRRGSRETRAVVLPFSRDMRHGSTMLPRHVPWFCHAPETHETRAVVQVCHTVPRRSL